MNFAIDVHYTDSTAMVSGVLFRAWEDVSPEQEYTCRVDKIANYESGNCYKRELPCNLKLLEKVDEFRIPTLLKRADQLCRTAVNANTISS